MKKFYSLSLAVVCSAAAAFAANTVAVDIATALPEREIQLKNDVSVVYAQSQAEATPAAEVAPESIIGKSYVTVYNDMQNNYNGFFTVKAGESGGVVLEGFAEGYDVDATYDAKTGKLYIPAGVVIGTHSTYGEIMLYQLNAAGTQYSNSVITATFDGDKVTFDTGVYGKVAAGGLIVMHQITATEANAQIQYSLTNNQTNETVTYTNPLLVTKTNDTTIKILGLSGILYGAYYDVAFTMDAAAQTVTLPFGTVVDNLFSQNRPYYLGGINIVGSIDNLTLKTITTEATSLLTADKMAYVYKNGTSYNGYIFSDIKVNVDFNIFTGEANGDDDGDDTTPTIDGISYELNTTDGTATVTGCLATVTNLDIPAQITAGEKTYTVNAVKSSAFQANKTLTSITIPASITTVGNDAFRNIANLKSLYIADLKAWCAIEFANGNANPLYNVYPTSTSKWGKVYVEGTAVTSLEIPEGVTSIGRAFYGFKALESIKLPSTLEVMGDQMLSGCIGLTEVEIPEAVKTMGSVFYGCTGLKKVTILGGVQTMGSTFSGCEALESVNLPEGLESLGSMAFISCESLTSIELPSTLKSIGTMAFDDCRGLREIKSHALAAPEAKVMAFDGVDTTIPVYVPAGSIDAYKAAAEWESFTNYKELSGGTSAIDDVAADNNSAAEYYTLQGVRVDNPAAGLYIRKQGNTVAKVLLK